MKNKAILILISFFLMFVLLSTIAFSQESNIIAEMKKAKIDWRQCEGQEITVNLSKITHAEAMVDLIPEFEEITGIKVNFEILSDEEYWNKLAIDLSSGAGSFDLVYTGNIFYNYISAGWLEPLDSYLNDPKLTDLEWFDVNDFWKIAWDTCRWDGKTIGPNTYGNGPIYSLPFDSESNILTYRKDLFEKNGLSVPQTWPDLVDTAKKLTKDGSYGFITRGVRKWSTIMYSGYSNGYFSYGGGDFDENLNPIFNKPEGVKFTELWKELIQSSAPPGYLSFTWDDARSLFMSGADYGMTTEADTFVLEWENPERSEVAGKLGYAHTPAGPKGHNAGYWAWTIGINSYSKSKKASWLFLQWCMSKAFLLRATADFLTFPPTRKSTWFDPKVVEMTGSWDSGNYRKVFTETMENAYTKMLWTVNPEMPAINEIWTEAMHKVVLNEATAQEALDELSIKADEIMKRLGYKK